LHQEDERISSVLEMRPFIDISIAVLRKKPDNTLEVVDYVEFSRDRQVELEVKLDPGSYIILPRTTGCLLKKRSLEGA